MAARLAKPRRSRRERRQPDRSRPHLPANRVASARSSAPETPPSLMARRRVAAAGPQPPPRSERARRPIPAPRQAAGATLPRCPEARCRGQAPSCGRPRAPHRIASSGEAGSRQEQPKRMKSPRSRSNPRSRKALQDRPRSPMTDRRRRRSARRAAMRARKDRLFCRVQRRPVATALRRSGPRWQEAPPPRAVPGQGQGVRCGRRPSPSVSVRSAGTSNR
jgi:hypothetical protein